MPWNPAKSNEKPNKISKFLHEVRELCKILSKLTKYVIYVENEKHALDFFSHHAQINKTGKQQ
jgi:hypothetical protein